MSFNPFDLTKVWSHKEYPLIEVGRMVLNRNPLNYFAEVEQVAFAPSHMIPGIEPSPDKMLQGRLFSYSDTHRHRLGANYQQIPINCPFNTKARNYQRDGPMCIYNQGSAPNYFPNSFQGPQPDPNEYAEHEESINKVNTLLLRLLRMIFAQNDLKPDSQRIISVNAENFIVMY